jgi:hypothetical protein
MVFSFRKRIALIQEQVSFYLLDCILLLDSLFVYFFLFLGIKEIQVTKKAREDFSNIRVIQGNARQGNRQLKSGNLSSVFKPIPPTTSSRDSFVSKMMMSAKFVCQPQENSRLPMNLYHP